MERIFPARKPMDPKVFRRARPVRNPIVVAEAGEDGVIRLRANVAETSVGLKARLARFGRPLTKTFELEEIGASIWAMCDGEHTVEGIARSLRERYKLNRIEAETALGSFLHTLAQRRLITMLVPEVHASKRR
ncbi:MAG: PqqD family protein [Fimbriimonadaceae bacterium]|nr:PqqD family protein [Fimbriimonadaceae bacterium]